MKTDWKLVAMISQQVSKGDPLVGFKVILSTPNNICGWQCWIGKQQSGGVKTVGNFLGKERGVESEAITRQQWSGSRNSGSGQPRWPEVGIKVLNVWLLCSARRDERKKIVLHFLILNNASSEDGVSLTFRMYKCAELSTQCVMSVVCTRYCLETVLKTGIRECWCCYQQRIPSA